MLNLRARSAASEASVPAGTRVYAVGDIHGRADLLRRLLASIAADMIDAPDRTILVFLGDYVDRGPDSRRVIDCLLERRPGLEMIYLRGNHDQVMLDFLADADVFRRWRDYGGRETLLSYGVRPPLFDDPDAFVEAQHRLRKAMPAEHLSFLTSTRLSWRMDGYFFAHAGIRPGIPFDDQEAEDLLWIRDEFLFSRADFGGVVVHGHTPAEQVQQTVNRIGIDTGAYATGQLTAVVLEGTSRRFLHT